MRRFSLIHAIWALFSYVRAECSGFCDESSHPDLDCSRALVCQHDWPSQTGNYGLSDVSIRSTTAGRKAVTFHDGLNNFTITEIRTDQGDNRLSNYHAPGENQSHRPNSDRRDTPGCCLPTVECFDFWDTIELKGYMDPGRLVIDDLEEWKRAECCLRDFLDPKPWCPEPPERRSTFTWFEPPRCAWLD